MTFEFGMGMFFYGMGAILIGAVIAYFIINKVMEKDKEPTRFDDLE